MTSICRSVSYTKNQSAKYDSKLLLAHWLPQAPPLCAGYPAVGKDFKYINPCVAVGWSDDDVDGQFSRRSLGCSDQIPDKCLVAPGWVDPGTTTSA
jgi:hypothetical protein